MQRIRQRFHASVRTSAIALIAMLTLAGLHPALAQVCPFDDGNSSLAVEGLILTRYALGVTGAPLVASTGINAVDAPSVEATINCPSCGLNITGNPTMTVADATIISRRLAGFSGAALTDGVALGSGTRNTPAAVASFLLAGCGATGGTVTSITAGTGLTGGTITGSGIIAVDPAVVQSRVSGSCVVGSSIRAIAADGNVTCQTDATGGSGTVTSVATGAGLTGGPITASGTINLAATQLLPTVACTTDQIAKWSGTAWVCTAPPPTIPTCVGGQIIGFALVGGALRCSSLPQTFTTVDNAAFQGEYSSVKVPADGLPVISYRSASGFDLKVAKCSNAACTAATITTVDGANVVGEYTSLAIGADGLPVISYSDATAPGALKVAKCSDAACTASSLTAVDITSGAVRDTSIAIGADGFPVISYNDSANEDLKVAKCTNAACTASTRTTIDSGGLVGEYTSIVVPADGLPVISYFDRTNTSLKVAKCSNAACTASTLFIVDAATAQPRTAIALSADGFPVISYRSDTFRLKVAKCGNAACTVSTQTFVDAVGSVGGDSAITVPADGLPVISYRDETNRALKVAKCSNAACTALTKITADNNGDVGSKGTSIAIGADGLPVVSYYDAPNSALKVLKCSNAGCANP